MINTIIQGDCLEVMKEISEKSIDMILCDLPYGTTACKWDTIIPFEPLWEQYKRVIKKNSAIVLFGREPFTSKLIISNIKEYKHKWVWNKKQSGSFQNAKYMPLQIEEDVICFCEGKVKYFPLMRIGKYRKKGGSKKKNLVAEGLMPCQKYNNLYFPINILEFPNCSNRKNNVHPTQKPVACINTNRNFIGVEKEPEYVEIARARVESAKRKREELLF